MPISAYYIKRNSAAPTTLAAAGVGSAQLIYRANALDSLTLTMSVASFHAAGPAFAFGDTIAIIQRSTAYPATPDKCIFVGTVERTPPQAIAAGEQIHRYEIFGPAYGLQLCDFSQKWTYRNATGTSIKAYEPTVCLGENSSGTRITSGQQIEDVLDYAIAKGLNLQRGTVAVGCQVPYDERQNVKCWEAIIAMLRYTPDYVLHFDYSTILAGAYCPTCNVLAPASMPAKSKAVTSLSFAEIEPRHDIRVPGLTIYFNYTDTIDGNTSRTRTTQSAGDTSHPRSVHLAYDLEGRNITYIKQDVEVEDYPDDWTNETSKPWLETQIPWLASLTTYTVESVDRSGSKYLPARLISGSLAPWMNKQQESETFTAEIKYTKKDSTASIVEVATRKISFSCLSTNAISRTYRKQSEYLGPEPVPSNMATVLFASWNRLHYEGQISYIEQHCSAAILPGHTLNITGGSIHAWASMQAVVQETTLNLETGSTAVTFGPCARLEADSLIAVFQAANGRSFCYRRQSRDAPDSSSGDIPGTGSTANSNNSDGAPADQIHHLRIVDKDASDRTHSIDLDPASTSFGTAANATATGLTIREMVIPFLDSSDNLKAKLAQVLCSEGYGAEIPLGGARPADPSNPATLGQNSEGASDDAVSTSYNAESATTGVSIWVCTRFRFDHSASTPVLYAYMSKLTFPAAIAPTVSGQTRVEIDTPQA